MNDARPRSWSFIAAGAAGLLIVAMAWVEARTFPLQNLQEGLGAAFFPYLVLGLIGILSVCLVGYGLAVDGAEGPQPLFGPGYRRAAALFAAFAAFAVAFSQFGLIASAAAFLIIAMRVLGAPWIGAAVVGAVAAGAIHALFVVGFGIPMP